MKDLPKPLEVLIGTLTVGVGISLGVIYGPESARKVADTFQAGAYGKMIVEALPIVGYTAMTLVGVDSIHKAVKESRCNTYRNERK